MKPALELRRRTVGAERHLELPRHECERRGSLVALSDGRLLAADELEGAKDVLSAAAWTYVAAFVAALAQLLYFFLASRR